MPGEEKPFDSYTYGEKMGMIFEKLSNFEKVQIQTKEEMNDKLDTFMEKCDKRLCDCEKKIEKHQDIISNAKGKITIISLVYFFVVGFLATNWNKLFDFFSK